MSKIVKKLKGKKKETGAVSETDEDYWQQKPQRTFNFDDETDDANKSDFLGFSILKKNHFFF